jgi:predicted acylesterase/phospholipase RssA
MDSKTMLHLGPPEPPTSRSRAMHELRLALAMRGGVSLAVWIGGACAEIEALRLSSAGAPTPAGMQPVPLYTELLEAAGYSGVTIDVLSGASAGGLNAALLSTSLVYGVPFERMKRLWLELADIEALLRDPGEPKPASVLKGDEYFLAQLQQTLEGVIAAARRADPASPVPRTLDLHLAVTLLEPVDVVVHEDWATRYAERTQRAAFHFRHNPYTSDFVDPADGRPNAGIAGRLALAARSSSSFPGAFEPARVRVRRPARIGQRGSAGPDDLFGILSQGSPEQIDVMDGGVLDNIPVERAIRSVATASAQGPTERWMLFLHPSPGEGVAAAEGPPDRRPGTVRTTLRALSTSASSESVLDDVNVLRQHNESASRYRMLHDALIGRLVETSPALAVSEATSGYGAYLRLRSGFAAARIRSLMENPVGVLGEDPFTDERYREPLGPLDGQEGAWPQELRATLEHLLARELREPPPWPIDGPLTQDIETIHLLGVPPLIRVVDTLIGVVRELESRGQPAAFADLKTRLYALRDVAALLDHMGDLFWPVYACHRRPQPARLGEWAEQAEAAREAFLRFSWKATGEAGTDPADLRLLPAGFQELFDHLRRELLRRWEQVDALPWAVDAVAPAGGGPDLDLVRELWVRLVACVLDIAEAAGAARLPAEAREDGSLWLFLDAFGWIRHPESYATAEAERAAGALFDDDDAAAASIEATLEEQGAPAPPASPAERTVQLLAAFEVLSFPLAMTALSGGQYIHYLRVAGSNVTPLQEWFPGGRLSVGDKLAGNELSNFAAFYKASWRANDWMWGRLDGATSLLDLLVRPSAISRHYGLGSPPEVRAAGFTATVERLVCAGPPATVELGAEERGQWEKHFQQLWAEHRKAVEAEIGELFSRPDGGTLLTRTRQVLLARRHWELLLSELPDVVLEAAGGDLEEGISPRWRWGGWSSGQRRRLKQESLMQAAFAVKAQGLDPLRQPAGMKKLLGKYRVGRETVAQEAGSDRFTRIGANLLVVAWNAVTGDQKLGFLRPIGWGLRLLRLLALAVVQAPRWAVVLLLSAIALGAYVAVEDKTWFGVDRELATVAVLVALTLLFYWSTFLWRGVMALAAVAAVAFAAFNLSGQVSLRFSDRLLFERRIEEVAFVLVLVVVPLLWSAGAWLRWRVRRRRAAAVPAPAAPEGRGG